MLQIYHSYLICFLLFYNFFLNSGEVELYGVRVESKCPTAVLSPGYFQNQQLVLESCLKDLLISILVYNTIDFPSNVRDIDVLTSLLSITYKQRRLFNLVRENFCYCTKFLLMMTDSEILQLMRACMISYVFLSRREYLTTKFCTYILRSLIAISLTTRSNISN